MNQIKIKNNKVLVISNLQLFSYFLKKTITNFDFFLIQNSSQILENIKKYHEINLILISLDKKTSKLITFLKSNFKTFNIPIIILLTKQADYKNLYKTKSLIKSGIDDILFIPSNIEELKIKLNLNIQKSYQNYKLNPLTKLPGNLFINKIMKQRLNNKIAILYADLDNFKAYNDKYGFIMGDKIIKQTSKIIFKATKEFGKSTDFIGHIGGDDFIVISTPSKVENIAKSICHQFDKTILKYYNKKDAQNKKIINCDRQGNFIEFPIMAISIAIITNERLILNSTIQISQMATELKQFAKTKPNGIDGSNFVKERRTK